MKKQSNCNFSPREKDILRSRRLGSVRSYQLAEVEVPFGILPSLSLLKTEENLRHILLYVE
jgi:hypothetical protein